MNLNMNDWEFISHSDSLITPERPFTYQTGRFFRKNIQSLCFVS
ncbi:hypothetical protein LEP1GSC172_1668 [Leptospira noguchii]|uniref:Uncharacterized protein n=1 Tax=Leptospira noguchii TaxID=28182 RepID=M6VUE0_9LEPT|nr:hypothetical protein LEP1GSC172_1668 [Leptospira noguchii]